MTYEMHPVDGIWHTTCESCGAVIWNPDAHTRFHQDIDRAAQQAHSADSMTRVIGGTQ